jgi:XTP/dITP diphosphohydrolase
LKIIVATANPGKYNEIREILDNGQNTLKSAAEVGFTEFPEETGNTFLENAYIKAKAVYDGLKGTLSPPFVVISDDSGLSVDELDGRPGVYSARFAGPNAKSDENIDKLLKEMQDIPEGKRQAAFICSVVGLTYREERFYAQGRLSGVITRERIGDSGFGYDPVFYLPAKGKTLAQMTSEEKNAISHRGKALKKLYIILRNCYREND